MAAGQHERLGYDSRHRVVIPNGFDTEMFRPDAAARAAVREELGIPAGARLVGMLARLHPMKDHGTLLEAMQLVFQHNPAVAFLLAGHGVVMQSPQFASLQNSALGRSTHLLGERADAARLFASLDVAVLSSYTESFPNAIGEAMACGVPCVSTDVGGVRELMGAEGIVVPARQPAALADGIMRYLSMTADERTQVGSHGRQRIERQFSLTSVVQKYEALYRDCLANGGKG